MVGGAGARCEERGEDMHVCIYVPSESVIERHCVGGSRTICNKNPELEE
jgi:hypothetical protein